MMTLSTLSRTATVQIQDLEPLNNYSLDISEEEMAFTIGGCGNAESAGRRVGRWVKELLTGPWFEW